MILSLLVFFYACKKKEDEVKVLKVEVQLQTQGNTSDPLEGIVVKLTSSGASFEESTDANGKVLFNVPTGIYEVSATTTRSVNGIAQIFNWAENNIIINDQWGTPSYTGGHPGGATGTITLLPAISEASQIVIKELFVGGTPRDDGSGAFQFDKYIILYNNSDAPANLGNLCLAMIAPFNAQASNSFYGTDGKLIYESENWIPAAQGYWYFQQNVTVQPGEQIVIALNNAVNNTLTYSKSINFDNPAYYATYDLEQYPNASYYPSPAASIPSNHYLKAQRYASGNAWSVSVSSPGVFIFDPKGTTPVAFAADASATHVPSLAAYTSKKVPVSWVVDGLEAFVMNNDNNQKRFLPSVDAGYVYHLNNQGYSIYRNVDKDATEALEENTGKLVYNYNGGTSDVGGSTDPSGIDAEASIRNGARIIYKDTNNSSNDFHLRKTASLSNN